jgi:hypothetical protein
MFTTFSTSDNNFAYVSKRAADALALLTTEILPKAKRGQVAELPIGAGFNTCFSLYGVGVSICDGVVFWCGASSPEDLYEGTLSDFVSYILHKYW